MQGSFKQITLIFLCLLLLFSSVAFAASREDAIKSGFIYNFARYSQGEWFNPNKAESYNICSFSAEFVAAAQYTLKDLRVGKTPVKLNLLDVNSKQLLTCHTLFISKNDRDKWYQLMAEGILSKVMLVGEIDNFIASGGHINFFIVGGKVRFEINPNKLKQSGINMSSKVLRLGRIYEGALE